MNKPNTNSETKAETISARQSLYIDSDYDDSFDTMLDTPFYHWHPAASFTDPICDYCGQAYNWNVSCQCH